MSAVVVDLDFSDTDPGPCLILTSTTPRAAADTQPTWKCPVCGLINLTTLDVPCIACFWNITPEERVLYELITGNKRNAKIEKLLCAHLDADVCGLIVEYLPRITLTDCCLKSGEETQTQWMREFTATMDCLVQIDSARSGIEVETKSLGFYNIPRFNPDNLPPSAFGKLTYGNAEKEKVYYFHHVHVHPTVSLSRTMIITCAPKDILSFMWGQWFAPQHRVEIAECQMDMQDDEIQKKWMAGNFGIWRDDIAMETRTILPYLLD